jgi:hypothetical protein
VKNDVSREQTGLLNMPKSILAEKNFTGILQPMT